MSISPLFAQVLENYELLESFNNLKNQYQQGHISRGILLTKMMTILTENKLTQSQKRQILGQIQKLSKTSANTNQKTVIIGNGDVLNLDQGREKVAQFGVDGVMIGRGIFQNPYLFAQLNDQNPVDKLNLLLWHLRLWQKTWQDRKKFPILKKYFKIYVQGFAKSSELRGRLMEANTFEEVEKIVFLWLDERNK